MAKGHAFYSSPIRFKASNSSAAYSFSTYFVFAIVSDVPDQSGHGMAFAIVPSTNLSTAQASWFLGLFNTHNDGLSSNRIVVVEIDTSKNPELGDKDSNHVGISINGLKARKASTAEYYTGENGEKRSLRLGSGDRIQIWIDYDGMNKRFRVLKGVAAGLLYLHEEWEQVVLHRDIKASNVLLDGQLNGRLGDFGLARLHNHGSDPQTTRVVGTVGYIAPELTTTGKATTCTDVFAFGAFVLEVTCAKRPIDHERRLVSLVLDCWKEGSVLDARDPKLGTEFDGEELELVMKLGVLCSHPLAAARPTMRQVMQVLEGDAPLPDVSPDDWVFKLMVLDGEYSQSSIDKAFANSSSSMPSSVLSIGR